MSLNLKFSVNEKCTTLALSGILNEKSSALDGVEVNPSFDLHIDLKDLKAINSLGIRNFHNWIMKVKCNRLRFFYCPQAFVAQLNMVSGFVPEKSEIESFFVPYFSEATGEDAVVLFSKHLEYRQDKGGNLSLNIPVVLDSQGNKMEIDIINDQYFRFLETYF